jgi:hypothetical protein
MEWNAPTATVIAVCLVLLIWYFVGGQWNRSRSRLIVRGLAKGFASLSPPPKLQWLGPTAFQIQAANPPDPFKQLGIMTVLQPRELLLFWLANRLRGRHDLLVIKGEFQNNPRLELELFDPATPTGREGGQTAAAERWIVSDAALPQHLRWAYPSGQADPRPRWAGIVDSLPFRLQRLSLRRSPPHLLMSLTPPPGEFPGDLLLKSLRAIGEQAVRPAAP